MDGVCRTTLDPTRSDPLFRDICLKTAYTLLAVLEGLSSTTQRSLHENMLRVELAEGLLRKGKLPQSEDNETSRLIKAMVDAWRDCKVEDIRMRGIRVSKHLKM